MKDSLFSVRSRFPSGESGNNILTLIGFRMRNSIFFRSVEMIPHGSVFSFLFFGAWPPA